MAGEAAESAAVIAAAIAKYFRILALLNLH